MQDDGSVHARIAEPSRNLEIHRLGLIEDVREEAYDRLTRLVAQLLNVPIARLSVVEPERQFFKSEANTTGDPDPMRETPLSHAFCKFVVGEEQPLIIGDASTHPVFREHPAFVEHGARAYAGIPVYSPSGNVLASFCVVDHEAREWTDDEIQTLETLADITMDEIKLRALTLDLIEAEETRTSLVDAIPDGIIGVNNEGTCIFANAAASMLLDCPLDQIIGTSIYSFSNRPGNQPRTTPTTRHLRQAIRAGDHHTISDTDLWRSDEMPIPVDLTISPVNRPGTAAGSVIVIRDNRERKVAEKARAEAEFKLRALFESIPAFIFIASPDNPYTILYMSPQTEQLTGYSLAELNELDGAAQALVHPDDRKIVQELADQLQPNRDSTIEFRILAKSGETFWVRTYSRLVADEQGQPLFWLSISVDISEEKRLKEHLARQMYVDPVTRLPNRTWLNEHLRGMARHGITAQHNTFALVYLDLDNFQVINNSLGHTAGDAILWHTAQRITGAINGYATVARLGGDEFAILFERVIDSHAIRNLTERILETVQQPIDIDGQSIVVTGSIGVAFGQPNSLIASEDIIKSADLAMHEAKRNGKARIAEFVPQMSTEIWERLNIEVSLRQAIHRNDLVVYYQPIIDLITGQIVEVEALVRWIHPERGMISPGEFIPIAEQCGLIHQIDQYVLRSAVAQVTEWRRTANLSDLRVAVNISSLEYVQPNLIRSIQRILDDHAFPGRALTLEITERYGIDNNVDSLKLLRRIRALGISLAIDDFGTGFSSLQYLKQFPVDAIKVDRTFVRDIASDDRDYTIVNAIMAVAKTLDLRVTAEGIEEEEQLFKLRELGCTRGQGFQFARPLPAGEVVHLLNAGRISLAQ